jgi:hypothetical protein
VRANNLIQCLVTINGYFHWLDVGNVAIVLEICVFYGFMSLLIAFTRSMSRLGCLVVHALVVVWQGDGWFSTPFIVVYGLYE